jgi:hypothetical protein
VRNHWRSAAALGVAAVLLAVAANAGPNPDGTGDAPQPSPARTGDWRVEGEKYPSPTGVRSEAGVGLSLGSHLTIQLNYARTASVPMMGYDSDNGLLARLRLAF